MNVNHIEDAWIDTPAGPDGPRENPTGVVVFLCLFFAGAFIFSAFWEPATQVEIPVLGRPMPCDDPDCETKEIGDGS